MVDLIEQHRRDFVEELKRSHEKFGHASQFAPIVETKSVATGELEGSHYFVGTCCAKARD